jgi:ATP-binding cassette, subfamily B, bacterial PglK
VMLRFGSTALNALHADMIVTPRVATGSGDTQPLRVLRHIDLVNVTFCYPNSDRPVLTDLSLTIPVNQTVGFVGSTGAGKTTVVDIVLGLLMPDRGRVEIDGVPIDADNVGRWQRSVGYVPQSIFLIDDTVAGNIAFGVRPPDICQEAVERAARLAELHDFVVRDLPSGYGTLVGERGVRLSGGQRQRLGIARALYHNPDVLVLDEATSALDSLTERALMQAIGNLAHRKTIILIAHRLSTVRACDQIFLLERGRLVKTGTYDQLVAGDSSFRKMVMLCEGRETDNANDQGASWNDGARRWDRG